MEPDFQEPEKLRVKYESALMEIPGITGVGIGLCQNEQSCLKIYTSVPAEQVLPLLPKELKTCNFELEFIGEVKAQ